jgi:UDP-N-acetylglucosamine transferase subunit ALG13
VIFVTVGAQMPFDRLVHAVDGWARAHACKDVFAQIGPGARPPQYIRSEPFLAPDRFRQVVEEAELVIAHAGMGTILTALVLQKPVLVMPRREQLLETRNDHQVATAERLARMGYVTAARDERELVARLETSLPLPRPERIGAHASPELLRALDDFIRSGG